jgi:Arc/MetJ-type ribon-helix-helix transcriptional regulator
MSIHLKEEQERRLRTYVDEGRFPTIDAAAQYLLDMAFVADNAPDLGDDDWVQPYIDEAEQAIREGRIISVDACLQNIRAKLAKTEG